MPDWVSVLAQYGVGGLGLVVAGIAVYGVVTIRRRGPGQADIAAGVAAAVKEGMAPLATEVGRNTEALNDLRVAVGELKGRINGKAGRQ
jgi:hypothetical protein